MSGKENFKTAAAASGQPSNSQVGSLTSGNQHTDVMSGNLTPLSNEEGSANQNDELFLITESLSQIEAILKAESKRRLEANKLTEEYINDYLDKLESSLNQRVMGQFQAMERRIQAVDGTLSKVEQ